MESLLKLYRNMENNTEIYLYPKTEEAFKNILEDLHNNFNHFGGYLNVNTSDYKNCYIYIRKNHYYRADWDEEGYDCINYGIVNKNKNWFIMEEEADQSNKFYTEKLSLFNLFKRIINNHINELDYKIEKIS